MAQPHAVDLLAEVNDQHGPIVVWCPPLELSEAGLWLSSLCGGVTVPVIEPTDVEEVTPILRGRNKKPRKAIMAELRILVPWATPRILHSVAESAPADAAYALVGSQYSLAPHTVRNRISRARKKT